MVVWLQVLIITNMHTRTYARILARYTYAHIHKTNYLSLSLSHARAHTHIHKHARMHARTRTHAHTHARARLIWISVLWKFLNAKYYQFSVKYGGVEEPNRETLNRKLVRTNKLFESIYGGKLASGFVQTN